MNLQLDHDSPRDRAERRSLWSDNRVWWINCLAIERFWFYAGSDLHAARARRDAMLTELIENW
jgi:hypothetical protein